MKMPNWGLLIAAVQKAVDDFRANKPLPPPAPMTSADVAAALTSLQAQLPTIIAAIQARPGVITAVDDILDMLDAQGVTWATEVEGGVNAAPGALATLSKWLPDIMFALGAFEPAPNPLPGMGPRIGRG